MSIVADIRIVRKSVPLKKPYRLSFATLESFDTIFAIVKLDSGQTGVGETVPVKGYGWEDAEETYSLLTSLAKELEGRAAAELLDELIQRQPQTPFAMTALLTSIESALYGWRSVPVPFQVPLAALFTPQDDPAKTREALSGYKDNKTFKIKLGVGDVESDLKMIKGLHEIDWGKSRLRFDANQAFDFEEALAVGVALAGLPVEFYEQPLHPQAWEDMARLTGRIEVPTMLDESIWTENDVRTTIKQKAARAIKLKLMKCGSTSHTLALVELARKNGLDVVLGNGIAGPLGCHQEAVLHRLSGLDTDGEMNGFLKVESSADRDAIRQAPGAVEIITVEPPMDAGALGG